MTQELSLEEQINDYTGKMSTVLVSSGDQTYSAYTEIFKTFLCDPRVDKNRVSEAFLNLNFKVSGHLLVFTSVTALIEDPETQADISESTMRTISRQADLSKIFQQVIAAKHALRNAQAPTWEAPEDDAFAGGPGQ